jgi:hypothetical protein
MITMKKILVPTDLSSISVPAIGYAISLAKDRAAEVVLLHVISMEAMKKHFTGDYGGGMALPAGPALNLQRQPDIDNYYEQKKTANPCFRPREDRTGNAPIGEDQTAHQTRENCRRNHCVG